MIVDKQWRILTVGDGDLSFSLSLAKHLKPASLCASVYDSETTLKQKYRHNAFDALRALNIEVLTGFDVTQPSSWQQLGTQRFDAVIFQFPLLPGFASHAEFQQQALTINTLNRRLLRLFLLNSTRYALDPDGQQLSIITSKDVKPYLEWNIEGSLAQDTTQHYLGQSAFDIHQFPEYKIRNVDRDKHVKDTSGISYYWSPLALHPLRQQLHQPPYLEEGFCTICRAGPFLTDKDREAHFGAKKHRTMAAHEQAWQDYLQDKSPL